MGSSTGAAGENAPNDGRSSAVAPPGPSSAAGRVLAAIARMSMRPEPSVVGAVDGSADDAGFAAGIASDCRFESENRTEFSWRWPVRFSTRPPSCPAIDPTLAPPPLLELGQFDAV